MNYEAMIDVICEYIFFFYSDYVTYACRVWTLKEQEHNTAHFLVFSWTYKLPLSDKIILKIRVSLTIDQMSFEKKGTKI